jgi:CRISPR system Cascade subunit CasC
MILELHLLQNFAPSCLNRDDTNAPKDCEFGGHRRARISSQCLKRAVRRHFQEHRLIPREHLAQRTKRVIDAVAEQAQGKDPAAARAAAAALLAAGGFKAEDDKTQYLLFLGQQEIDRLARLLLDHWDALARPPEPKEPAPAEGKKKTAKKEKSEAKAALPPEVVKAVAKALDGGKAADLALFGRMLADLPEKNIDAACQVAHAFTVNKVSAMEMDYYTAVDDRKPEDTAGADMIGTVEFTSGCFYRYASLDVAQLAANLQGDRELARRTVAAFLRASVAAIPTGKQNSMAAHNPPDLVLAVARPHGRWSLANAFVQPVRPNEQGSLTANAIAALDAYWAKLTAVFGGDGLAAAYCTTADRDLAALPGARVPGVAQLVDTALAALDAGEGGA